MVETRRFSEKRSKLRKDQPRKLFPAYQSGEFLCGKLFNPRSLKAFTKLTFFFGDGRTNWINFEFFKTNSDTFY